MSHELHMARHALVEQRDKFDVAIQALTLIGKPIGDRQSAAAVRPRGSTPPKKKAARNPDRAVTQSPSAPASADIVQARDASILKALKYAPKAARFVRMRLKRNGPGEPANNGSRRWARLQVRLPPVVRT
jgi:hypothetical protein